METFKTKSYCYKNDCKAVRAGFHLEDYAVCQICKLEISVELYKSIKQKEDRKSKEEDSETLWGL